MPREAKILSALAAVLAFLIGGCGGPAAFKLSSEDNSLPALRTALGRGEAIAAAPRNTLGKPVAFLVMAGAKRRLVAYDLAAKAELWSVDADVQSRVVVGGPLIAALEGQNRIVARDVQTGAVRWTHELSAKTKFLGMAADGSRVFLSVQDDSEERTWYVIALENGDELWKKESNGVLGAPAARGGLVYMPYLKQWLTIIDGTTGEQLARIRQKDEAITFVRATSDGVYYGSQGVFRLDERAVAGTRGASTYGKAKLPDFATPHYHFDAFNRVEAGYSAFDRRRLLWRAPAEQADKELDFANGQVVLLSFRFFFAFDAQSGALLWAHRHPRGDVVAAEHAGGALVYVSQNGELGALDAGNGARLLDGKIEGRVLGATIDADGFRPEGQGQPVDTADALAAIVRDKDSRLETQKMFALKAMAGIDDPKVVETLLAVLVDSALPEAIRQAAAEALTARADPKDAPVLVKALDVRYDYIDGTTPQSLATIARALGAMGSPGAVTVLAAHFEDPATPDQALPAIAWALGQSKSPDALPPLRTFLLMYRADPRVAESSELMGAVIEALVGLGSGAERELLAFVAADPRSAPAVADAARAALKPTQPQKGAETPVVPPPAPAATGTAPSASR